MLFQEPPRTTRHREVWRVEVVPNAINELVHWQMQGYALVTPKIMSKQFSVESIR